MAANSDGAMLSQSECRELFAAVQQAAKSLGVSDVEALFGAHCAALTRFANNTIHQNVAEQDRWLSIRVVIDRQTARATTNRFDPDSIRGAVEQALALARSSAPNSDLLPLTEPSLISVTKRFDEHTAAATPAHRGQAVAEAIRIVESAGQTAAGIYSTGQSIEAILNSRGVSAWHAETMAQFSITAMAGDSSGWAKASAVSHAAIDPVALARSASEKARLSSDPQEIAPGRYTVILEPAAVLDLVGQMFGDFSATSVNDSRSFLTDRLGTKLFGDNIHISDDVAHPLQAGVPFDGEGVPRRKLTLVDAGVPRELAYSRSSATPRRSRSHRPRLSIAQRSRRSAAQHRNCRRLNFRRPNDLIDRSRHSRHPSLVHSRSGTVRQDHDRHDSRWHFFDRKWPRGPRPAEFPLQSRHHRIAEQCRSAFALGPRLRRRDFRYGGSGHEGPQFQLY